MSFSPFVRPPDGARKRLEAHLKQTHLSLAGLPTITTQSFFLAPSSLNEKVVLWIARSPQERDQLYALLCFWFSRQGGEAPPALVVCSEEHIVSPLLPPALLALFDGEPTWFLATTDDLARQLPSPDLLRKTVLGLSTGQVLSPGALSQSLSELGYEFAMHVTEPGMFARRGGIVDVWPYGYRDPLRFDIIDQRLEKITTFNWKTQRNRDERRESAIPPRVLPKANQATLVHYLQHVRDRVRVVAPAKDELIAIDPKAKDVLERFSGFPSISFLPFTGDAAQFDFQASPLFHRDFDRLRAEIHKRAGWTIWLLSTHHFELRERYGDAIKKHLVEIDENERPLLQGFESAHEKTLLLTDWEIYGHEEEREQRGTRRSERAEVAFVADLRAGDYVVHVDHGIGRFTGTLVQEVDGHAREYFVVLYAEDDKLFVPVELADKLTKYIGVAHPKLHRLSGGGWYQMKRRIKEETRATAEELLKLYAERETVSGIALRVMREEQALADSFPYDVTPDQRKALEDITHDLKQKRPMDRLICGDVGFGKTEVAIRIALKAVLNRKQVAILSPTTILTQQHFDTFRERLAGFGVVIEQLSRFRTPKQQRDTLEQLALGHIDIIIGTHRLLQPDVRFRDLGLVVIDEEQRFGVQHKERLKRLRLQAHVLTLTATPIPRTLNFALSGIRDISVIETPPEGRKPIETHIDAYHDSTVRRALEKELQRKGQVYFVYNNVNTIDLRMRELQKLVPNARYGVAHGQLPEDHLAKIMARFDNKEIDVLVCSTIIENGLDLPNVNTLIVDHATHFGLAQLYQLRGRIGRGRNQAYAYFLYRTQKLTPEARKRLQALLEARDLGSGFQLALRDLEIRGTGSILGKKQHGHVAAVGLTLYSRLLAETIQEMRAGREAVPTTEILIDLPLSIRIPKELEPNETKRLSFYQKLALETSIETLEFRAQRLFHRKVFPEPVQNLIDVLTLRILGQPVRVTRIALLRGVKGNDPYSQRLVLDFAQSLVPAQLKALIELNGAWQFGENQVKISLSALGDRWMEALQQTLVALEKSRHLTVDPAVANGRQEKERRPTHE
jgi:transcription-repair coupling factor (superfamily II helicase)